MQESQHETDIRQNIPVYRMTHSNSEEILKVAFDDLFTLFCLNFGLSISFKNGDYLCMLPALFDRFSLPGIEFFVHLIIFI